MDVHSRVCERKREKRRKRARGERERDDVTDERAGRETKRNEERE